jgi:integrase
MALTVKKVAKLIRRGVPGRYLDGGGTGVRGLYLCIGGPRNAHYELRFQLRGRGRWMGLGSAFDFSLTEARERARKERQRLHDKDDPLEARRAERAAKAAAAASTKTFRECADAYIQQHQAGWKSAKHGQTWQLSLRDYVFPKIGAMNVAAIDRQHVLQVLEQPVQAALGYPAGPFWLSRSVTADRVRTRIKLILDWAKVRGYRTGDNPASGELIKQALPKPTNVAPVRHHAALPYQQIPQFIQTLRQRAGVGPRALEFLILTAARAGEVLGATWDEVDEANKVWTISAERMKASKEHRVPLSDPALALLRGLPREHGNGHVFIGARQSRLSEATMGRLLRDRLGGGATVHGFRSSFSDWSHEQTAQPNHVIEMALSHSVGTAVEKAYRRTDLFAKRRTLMEAWARFCTTPTPRRETGKVTPIRAKADVL